MATRTVPSNGTQPKLGIMPFNLQYSATTQHFTQTMHRYTVEAEEIDLIMSTSPGQLMLMLRTELSC